MNFTTLVLSFTLAFPGLEGQPPDVALPAIPPPANFYTSRVPHNLDWLIVVSPTGKGPVQPSSNPGLPLKYLYAQLWSRSSGGLNCVNEWTDGTKTHDKIDNGTKFFESPQDHGIHVFNPKLDPRYHDFNAGDFDLLDWMTPADYVGAFTHAGTSCYLYRSKAAPPARVDKPSSEKHNLSAAALHAPASPTSAYINIASGLPVAIDNADGEYLFTFGAPGTLQLPAPSPRPAITEPAPLKKPAPHHKRPRHHTKSVTDATAGA